MSLSNVISGAYALTGRRDIRLAEMHLLLKQVMFQINVSSKWGESYREETVDLGLMEAQHSVTMDALSTAVAIELVVAKRPDSSHEVLQARLPRDIVSLGPYCNGAGTYYRSGTRMNVQGYYPFNQLYVGWYATIPNDLEAAPDYWMFTTIPEILVAGLAAQIYRLLGEDTTFSMYEMEFQRLLAVFKGNRSDGEVR